MGCIQGLGMSKLIAQQLDHAEPRPKPYKLYDGDGLLIIIRPNGNKWWRFKYRYAGKEQSYSVGVYPVVSIDGAREIRDWCREQLSRGIDPNTVKRESKARERTEAEIEQARRAELVLTQFNTIAEEWYKLEEKKWKAQTLRALRQRLDDYILPVLGKLQIAAIIAPDYLPILRSLEAADKLDTAHRVKDIIGKVLRYSAATRALGIDTTGNLRGMLVPIKGDNHQAITDPDKLGPLLRSIWDYNGKPVVKAALRLGAYLYKRPSELRLAEWQ